MAVARVYRLKVTIPPELQEYGYTPPGWVEHCAYHGFLDPDGGAMPFGVGQRRNYFSKATAQLHAARMRRWGVEVEVFESAPLVFDGEPLPHAPCTDPAPPPGYHRGMEVEF